MDTITFSHDTGSIVDLIVRLVINMTFVITISRFFYFPKSRRRDFFFTFILVGFCIFMLINLMCGLKMKTGIGMGLFAIFCIMRYRTESVPIREMTYLFLIICMAAVNGMGWDRKIDTLEDTAIVGLEVLITDLLFLAAVALAETRRIFAKGLSSKYVKYDKIDLIKPERRNELIADLKERTGLDITSVSIGSIDFLKDMALIKIYYNENGSESENAALKMPKTYE